MNTPYASTLVTRADDVDRAAWQGLCGREGNPFLDLRFLKAVELSFAGESRCWYAIFRNDAGRPVACTCFFSYEVDGALMTSRTFQNIAAGIRRVWKGFLKYKMLLCGTPISTCGNHLAIAEFADMERLAPALDEVSVKLAKETDSRLITYKEFAPDETIRLAAMEGHKYLPARSIIAYSLAGEYASFDQYVASRSKRTRANIRRSLKKFETSGCTCEQLRGRDGIEDLFTDDVHTLYLNVLDRASLKFERVPAEFFRELARQLPDDSCFTIVRKEGRIVAFCCAIASRGAHNMLYCGLDYSLNAEADLYFNIIYRGLSQGTIPGVRVVHVGGAADEFKRRMGCYGEPLSIYVKAQGPILKFLFKHCFGLLFDTTKAPLLPLPELASAATDDGDMERIAA